MDHLGSIGQQSYFYLQRNFLKIRKNCRLKVFYLIFLLKHVKKRNYDHKVVFNKQIIDFYFIFVFHFVLKGAPKEHADLSVFVKNSQFSDYFRSVAFIISLILTTLLIKVIRSIILRIFLIPRIIRLQQKRVVICPMDLL